MEVSPEFTTAFPLAENCDGADRRHRYSIKDGKVWWLHHEIRAADPETFGFYAGGFAKDARNRYSQKKRLSGANPLTFRALNFAYATDDHFVWTIAGRVKDAIASEFEACDDGYYDVGFPQHPCLVPHSFGKDRTRVFYYDFDGKPTWVRKADPATFVSLNDGHFGMDQSHALWRSYALPKADMRSWRKAGGNYSLDDRRVYSANRLIDGADPATFTIVPNNRGLQLAYDRFRGFDAGIGVEIEGFRSWCRNLVDSEEAYSHLCMRIDALRGGS